MAYIRDYPPPPVGGGGVKETNLKRQNYYTPLNLYLIDECNNTWSNLCRGEGILVAGNLAENWQCFKQQFQICEVASGLAKKIWKGSSDDTAARGGTRGLGSRLTRTRLTYVTSQQYVNSVI